jgi:hypothetical protein
MDDEATRAREKEAEERQAQAEAEAEAAAKRQKQEAAAKTIQRHMRGALARMSSKVRMRENRMDELLKRLMAAVQRLEAGEEFTEAELQQLAADMAEVLALLKVRTNTHSVPLFLPAAFLGLSVRAFG